MIEKKIELKIEELKNEIEQHNHKFKLFKYQEFWKWIGIPKNKRKESTSIIDFYLRKNKISVRVNFFTYANFTNAPKDKHIVFVINEAFLIPDSNNSHESIAKSDFVANEKTKMPVLNHTENTKRIISYLSYLRDISRKVVTRSGFEKCLLNKTMGSGLQIDKISFEIAHSDKNYPKLKSYLNFIETSNDKKMFIGFGTFVGTSKRIFAAPLLILQCELTINELSQSISIEPDFDTLNLNYDFISSLSTNYLNEEDDVFNPISDAEQQTIERIEKELKEISSLNFESFTNLISKIFKEFTSNIEHFKEVKQIDIKNYDYQKELGIYNKRFLRRNKDKEKEKSIFDKQLVFINSHHLFVNQIPDQLSTYEALNTFVQNISEENDFKNPVVEKLLVNALTEERAEIEFKENSEVEELIKYFIPLSLSATQTQAIKNAWSNEISYIQGPPGTGKSHTISALVLSALFLKKKVLVISQKQPALQVVNKKIEPYLSDDNKIIGISYYDKSARKRIKEYWLFIKLSG